MRKVSMMLIAALLLGASWAAGFPSEGDVVVHAEGSVVAAGQFENGDLELELLAGFTGFATLTVVDEDGNETSVDVMIDSDGSIVLSESLQDLREVVSENGGEVSVSVEETIDASGNMAFGAGVPDHVELPEVARVGMDGAAGSNAEAKAGAGERRSNAGASTEAEARGKAEAEVDGDEDGGDVEAEGEARGKASAGAGNGNAEAGAEGGASVGVGVGTD